MSDLISRQAAIDALKRAEALTRAFGYHNVIETIRELPPAQPERLSDDDFETIRIHLNAYKENLCNQHRWEEAEEYQRIINRFMAFASAQPEIIRCKDCKHKPVLDEDGDPEFPTERCPCQCDDYYYSWIPKDDWFCGNAERREE